MPNYESYQVIKEITLDLVAPGLAPVVNVPQYDTKGRVVKVNLVSNSAAYEIESDFEVHAVMSKKDGKSVNNPCVVDGSTVYAVISKQMTVFEGRQMVAISITNNSDVELKAFPFVLNVIRAPSDAESYASEDEHLAFETTYKQVLEAKTAAENAAESAAESALNAKNSEKSASDAAKKIEGSAKKIDQNADAVSQLKEDLDYKLDKTAVGEKELKFTNSGYMRASDGVVVESPSAQNTGFFAIDGVNRIIAHVRLSEAGAKIAFYNRNKEYLKDISVISTGSPDEKIDLDIISDVYANAKYCIISNYGVEPKMAKVIGTVAPYFVKATADEAKATADEAITPIRTTFFDEVNIGVPENVENVQRIPYNNGVVNSVSNAWSLIFKCKPNTDYYIYP